MIISILDYQMGNIMSVKRKLERLGATCEVISSPEEVLQATKLVLPGVGHFGKAMEHLREHKLVQALNETVLHRKIPVLGICLGMQLMCKRSEEGNLEGLGWFNAEVTRILVKDKLRFKVPHTGWNEIEFDPETPLMKGMVRGSEFYFVHAFEVKIADRDQVITKTTYETTFISGLSQGNIFGFQFHPEKSHSAGDQLLKNFIAL